VSVLIPALLAVLLSETGGKVQAIAHAYGQSQRMREGILALFVSSVGAYAIAAISGYFIGQILPAEARSLMFGVALLAAGLPMVTKPKSAAALPIGGGFLKSVIAFVRAQLGDAAQFLVFALAMRGDSPALAALGALGGVVAAGFLPMALNNDWPAPRTLQFTRWGCAIVLTVFGFLISINALGLVYRGD
jgi:Ca2+/H+ antiporter, TMEM165/GDT1 family